MKRDMELIREIRLAVEEAPSPDDDIELILVDHAPEVVSYHVKLLHQAGLIEAVDRSTMDEFEWSPRSLTWSGHEFLDAARSSTVWQKTMSKLKEQAASAPFEIVKATLMHVYRESFGIG